MSPECNCLRAALPRLVLLYDLSLLLLPAAALPVLRQCGLITVYRCTHQCGERSNAAFGRQSAAVLPSLAPHDSKARLRVVTKRRDSWRSHVHRTHTAQRVQPFKLQTRNGGVKGRRPLRSLGGPRGPFSHVREWPPFPYPPRVWGKCPTTYKWSISAHSTVYISSRCRRGRDRCGRSSGPCGAAFSPCRRRRWRRRCRRPRARA